MTSTLRSADPVRFDASTGLWQVSERATIRAVLADPETFRPDNALTAFTPLSPASLRVLARAGFALPPVLANNGGPSHPALRRLTAQFFSASAVEHALPGIRLLAESAASAVQRALSVDESADLVGLVTAELPCRVLLPLLGVDADWSDAATLVRWSGAALELFWGRPEAEQQRALAAEAAELYRWVLDRLAAAPVPGSLFAAVTSYRSDAGVALSRRQAASLCYFLLVAGHQTTSQLLAIALRRTIAEPELWHRLGDDRAGPLLAQECVERVLRYEPPVTTWRRVLSRPAVVGGVGLPAGSQLLLMLAPVAPEDSPVAGACPIASVTQGDTAHLAFGYGRHFCLGAGLARAEAGVVLSTLARELPGLRLCDDPFAPQLRLLSFTAPTRVLVRSSGPR